MLWGKCVLVLTRKRSFLPKKIRVVLEGAVKRKTERNPLSRSLSLDMSVPVWFLAYRDDLDVRPGVDMQDALQRPVRVERQLGAAKSPAHQHVRLRFWPGRCPGQTACQGKGNQRSREPRKEQQDDCGRLWVWQSNDTGPLG